MPCGAAPEASSARRKRRSGFGISFRAMPSTSKGSGRSRPKPSTTTARDLANAYHTWDAFRAAVEAAIEGGHGSDAYRDIDNIEGIGETVVDALIDFFSEPLNKKALDELLEEVTVQPYTRVTAARS